VGAGQPVHGAVNVCPPGAPSGRRSAGSPARARRGGRP
jgi:hypothetical protein